MKKFIYLFIVCVAAIAQSCIVVNDAPGPQGRPGRAFVGIDYDYNPPYSYWDNNPGMPSSPYFGEYYQSYGGVYDFEYFVNRVDYWYGTYEVYIRRGGPGRPYGEPGLDGGDSFLLLICNPNGPYEERKAQSKVELIDMKENADGSIEYSIDNGDAMLKVKMQKTNIKQRPSKEPKVIF